MERFFLIAFFNLTENGQTVQDNWCKSAHVLRTCSRRGDASCWCPLIIMSTVLVHLQLRLYNVPCSRYRMTPLLHPQNAETRRYNATQRFGWCIIESNLVSWHEEEDVPCINHLISTIFLVQHLNRTFDRKTGDEPEEVQPISGTEHSLQTTRHQWTFDWLIYRYSVRYLQFYMGYCIIYILHWFLTVLILWFWSEYFFNAMFNPTFQSGWSDMAIITSSIKKMLHQRP